MNSALGWGRKILKLNSALGWGGNIVKLNSALGLGRKLIGSTNSSSIVRVLGDLARSWKKKHFTKIHHNYYSTLYMVYKKRTIFIHISPVS